MTMTYVVSQHDGWEFNPIVKVFDDLEAAKKYVLRHARKYYCNAEIDQMGSDTWQSSPFRITKIPLTTR